MRAIFVWVLFHLFAVPSFAQSTGAGSGDSLPPGKALVEAEIATNWIDNGITQTDSTPSIHATVGYKWPQFKTGLFGSNFRASPSGDSSNLRGFGAYKFIITNNIDFTGRLDLSRYFSAGDANGTRFSIDVNMYQYHVDIEQIENWEATGDAALHFGFHKDFQLQQFIWSLKFGYDIPNAATVTSYFDFLTSIGYKHQEMKFDLVLSATSNSTQLNARGKPAVFLVFSVNPE